MLPELACSHVQRSIRAIQQIVLAVKGGQGQWIDRCCIFQNSFAVVQLLPFGGVFDILHLPFFIGERLPGSIDQQSTCNFLAEVHSLQTAQIRNPPFSVKEIPLFALHHIAAYIPRKVSEQIAVSGIMPAVLRFRVHRFQAFDQPCFIAPAHPIRCVGCCAFLPSSQRGEHGAFQFLV